MTSDDFESVLGKFRSDAAAEALRQAILDLEKKFDPSQPRAPVGTSNGGQWVDAGRGGGGGAKVRKPPGTGTSPKRKVRQLVQAARVLAGHPQAGPLVQAVGLPVIAGGVALTRAIGDFDSQITGREKTPFLKLPAEKLDLRITPNNRPKASRSDSGGFDRSDRARIEEECDEFEREEEIKCSTYAAMYGRSRADQKRIARICLSSVAERVSECRKNGGPNGVNTPLYMGRR